MLSETTLSQALTELLKSHFFWGLTLGLLVAAFIWKNAIAASFNFKRERKKLEGELRDLQSHLNTQLKINASGNQVMQQELDELRKQNENLRVNQAALQQKPGRAEQRQLQILEAAARQMREQAPGFAPAWEKALRQAEQDLNDADSGLKKLIRKVLPANSTSTTPLLSSEDDADD